MKYHIKGVGGRRKKKEVIKQALSPQMKELMKYEVIRIKLDRGQDRVHTENMYLL